METSVVGLLRFKQIEPHIIDQGGWRHETVSIARRSQVIVKFYGILVYVGN